MCHDVFCLVTICSIMWQHVLINVTMCSIIMSQYVPLHHNEFHYITMCSLIIAQYVPLRHNEFHYIIMCSLIMAQCVSLCHNVFHYITVCSLIMSQCVPSYVTKSFIITSHVSGYLHLTIYMKNKCQHCVWKYLTEYLTRWWGWKCWWPDDQLPLVDRWETYL